MSDVLLILIITIIALILFIPFFMLLGWLCLIISNIFTMISKFCVRIVEQFLIY